MKIGSLEIEIENKCKVAAYLAVTVLCVGYTAVNLLSSKPAAGPVDGNNLPAGQVQQEESAASDGGKETVKVSAPGDLLAFNPFVEMSSLDKVDENGEPTGKSNLPAIPQGFNSASPPAGGIPLPKIPNMGAGMPAVGAAAMPPANSPGVSAAGPATVQGVLTGDDGKNMAIMSDGRVVTEGESFQDGRIAYIGGDGIHFEDGHTLGYK